VCIAWYRWLLASNQLGTQKEIQANCSSLEGY